MFKRKISDVFFDLDHTLWDFEKNSELTFKKIFELHCLQIELEMFLQSYIPINFHFWKLYREEKVTKEVLRYQRLRQSFEAIGVNISDEVIHQLADDYVEHLATFNHVIPGTFEILDYLNGSYRLHIITNGFEEVQKRKMVNANIWHYFEVVVNSEMAGVKKPHSAIFHLALDMARVLPENSLMIGDNLEADILGAQKVGFNVLHYNYASEPVHNHCKIIHHLDEIKHFL